MKQKVYGILLTVLVFAVPLAVVFLKPSPQPDTERVVYNNIFTPVGDGINGPTKAVVGQLVRLAIDAEQVKWQCLPPVEDIETYGSANEKCVVSFRSNGNYTVVAAVLKDSKVDLQTIQINVGGFVPAPVDPKNPDKPNNTTKVDTELAAKVRSWAVDSGVNRSIAGQLGTNFKQVASETQAGDLTTTGEIINRTASLNQSLDLKGFDGVMAKIQAYLTQQADSGALSTPEQHITVWYSIASGLETYSRESSGNRR